jgi:hypothetical protein
MAGPGEAAHAPPTDTRRMIENGTYPAPPTINRVVANAVAEHLQGRSQSRAEYRVDARSYPAAPTMSSIVAGAVAAQVRA